MTTDGSNGPPAALPQPFAIVGAGRLGHALTSALRAAGEPVSGPHGRGYHGTDDAVVLLCVPDREIAAAATAIATGPLLGHCSGASRLDLLGGREGFSVHPMMTVSGAGADFRAVPAAVAATSERALLVARALTDALGMRSIDIAEHDRVAYHAAGVIAANFLVTLESAAAELLATTGYGREVLLPLTRAALENWGRLGTAALTGPIARDDRAVVDAHRAVVAERTPHLVALFDALAAATRRVAAGQD